VIILRGHNRPLFYYQHTSHYLTTMTEVLPIYFDEQSDPNVMKIVYAYRPHTTPPSRQELMERKYQLDGHCSVRELTKQMGLEYTNEINRRK